MPHGTDLLKSFLYNLNLVSKLQDRDGRGGKSVVEDLFTIIRVAIYPPVYRYGYEGNCTK